VVYLKAIFHFPFVIFHLPLVALADVNIGWTRCAMETNKMTNEKWQIVLALNPKWKMVSASR
jgi:hypothetical protein